MNTENIFFDVQRWTQYSHPLKDLEHLQSKGTPDHIKNYFLHKTINGSILRKISSRQVEKIQQNIKSVKVKMILKEKSKKFSLNKKLENGNAAASAKTSIKTNNWSEEEPEVSQYLNFQEQEEHPVIKVE